MTASTQDSNNAWKMYGVYIQPSIGQAYPELNVKLQKLFLDKVSKIPWLPQGWYDAQAGIQAANPSDQVRIAPVYRADGIAINPLAPSWLDTKEKRDIWQNLCDQCNAAIMKYAAGQAAAGAAELDYLYAKAAFWGAAYNAAVFVRDIPSEITEGVSDVGVGVIKKALPLLLIAGVGVAVLIYLASKGGVKGITKGAVG